MQQEENRNCTEEHGDNGWHCGNQYDYLCDILAVIHYASKYCAYYATDGCNIWILEK
jgi:hypothetical protein